MLADLTTITWKLKDGLLCMDGSPVTAEDAVFTGSIVLYRLAAARRSQNFTDVKSIEAVDPQTIKVTFSVPQTLPLRAAGSAHRRRSSRKSNSPSCLWGPRRRSAPQANTYPIGTGPFVVKDFKANDTVLLEANPNFRDPAKPAFATLVLKGGGDAASAARAVLETGEFDYAWISQFEPYWSRWRPAGGAKVILGLRQATSSASISTRLHPDPRWATTRSTEAQRAPRS